FFIAHYALPSCVSFPLLSHSISLPCIFTRVPYTTLFRSTALDESLNARVFDTVVRLPLAVGGRNEGLQPLRDLDNIRSFLGSQRSEEHTSELQSRFELVCRPLLEKKKT